MRLSYRGHAYESGTIPMEMVDFEKTGKYRGNECHFSYPRHIPVPQPSHDLRFRGVEYHTTETGAVAPLARRSAGATPSHPSETLAQRATRVQHNDLMQVHRINLQRRLQHRLAVAQERGDHELIQQLEREMQQIV